jgi:hypothetical protein
LLLLLGGSAVAVVCVSGFVLPGMVVRALSF